MLLNNYERVLHNPSKKTRRVCETLMLPYAATFKNDHFRIKPKCKATMVTSLNQQHKKSLVIRNAHVKYDIHITYQSRDMATVQVFKSWSKFKVKARMSKSKVPIER
jgi:hypothetical protein